MNINQIIQMIGTINNPNQALQRIIMQNPQFRGLLNEIKKSGSNPTQYLKEYAQKNNIDLTPINDILNSKGVKF